MKKNRIKKIILVCSLVCVLFVSFAIPTFAYTRVDASELSTWKDYVNDDGSLNFTLFGRKLENNYFYLDDDGNWKYCLYVDPNDFGNYAEFNGCFSVRFEKGTSIDDLTKGYDYELGYFDFTSSNRVQSVKLSSGTVRVDCFDLYSEFEYFRKYLSFRDGIPSAVQNRIYDLYNQNKIPNEHTKALQFYIAPNYYDLVGNLYCGIAIFPNLQTAENISKDWQDKYEGLNNQVQIKNEEISNLTAENFNLSAAYTEAARELEHEKSQFNMLKQNYEQMSRENAQMQENGGVISALFAGIGQGFANFFTPILNIGFLGISIGSILTVAVVIFVVLIVLKIIRG